MKRRSVLVLTTALLMVSCTTPSDKPKVVVGSLKDVEGTILGEIFAQVLESTGEVQVERQLGLGGTGVLFEAMAAKRIDVAPQYSATLANVILKKPALTTFAQIAGEARALFDVGAPLGFNNTYGIGVTQASADEHHLGKVSDLRGRAWRGGVSPEFMQSPYGLSGVIQQYGLSLGEVKSMEHVISYVALAQGAVDFVDVYTTDAAIDRQQLVVLRDDLNFFPRYEGLALARKGFAEAYPRSWAALELLQGTLSDAQMTKLNAELEIEKKSPGLIAQTFLKNLQTPIVSAVVPVSEVHQFMVWTWQHMLLVSVALFFALLVGIPLGIWAGHRPRLGRFALSAVGVVQTIPGVALLCFFIPLVGIGTPPALMALTLYALLPIVQGMVTGLAATAPSLHQVSQVLGMTRSQKLWRLEMPLAFPALLAGVRVATVTTVGTAALAAFIGAGGYGTPIAKGLALADWSLVFQGALPSAVLAILAHGFFSWVEARVLKR
jgi:osmoprotectant transport system permease protein